ncbi:MAG: nucleobase:cation symporter, family [Gaiellaceae bacterium]|nr:nucleobase:cation symporter, family [Gaiellaceae bacterium]
MSETRAWGIEPVPERLRVLGGLDTLLLWTNLGISLLVLVAASYFGLSLKQALLATLVGGVIGNSMLAVAALIGADARVPTMTLQRAPLGQRGSYLATALNILQCLGWSIFEITVIAIAASALSERVFGFHATWVWKLVFGAVALWLALLGPIGFVRRFVRKVGIWAVGASVVYLAWWILHNGHVGRLWNEGGHGGSFWLAVDLVIALTVSWIPLVADYTRFSRDRRSAFWGAGLGYLLPTLFQFGFGAVLVLSHPKIGGDATNVLTTVAAGGVASILALLALTVDESDEAFANVYSTAVSLQNVFPRASQRVLILGVATLATAGALAVNLTKYPQFLYLLGGFFVPLFGALLADWLHRGRHYTRADIFEGPLFRPWMIAAWLAGFLVYEWFGQTPGLGFWSDFWARHLPPAWLPFGASLPAFVVTFVLALSISALERTRAPAPAEAG